MLCFVNLVHCAWHLLTIINVVFGVLVGVESILAVNPIEADVGPLAMAVREAADVAAAVGGGAVIWVDVNKALIPVKVEVLLLGTEKGIVRRLPPLDRLNAFTTCLPCRACGRGYWCCCCLGSGGTAVMVRREGPRGHRRSFLPPMTYRRSI